MVVNTTGAGRKEPVYLRRCKANTVSELGLVPFELTVFCYLGNYYDPSKESHLWLIATFPAGGVTTLYGDGVSKPAHLIIPISTLDIKLTCLWPALTLLVYYQWSAISST